MIAISHENNWVLLNSSFHNKLVKELIDDKSIKQLEYYHVKQPEYSYGNSRLDFLLCDDNNNELYLEVKGCTLVMDTIAKFPDAPTKRGQKHLNELIEIKENHKDSAVIILVLQNNAIAFMPNYETDPSFSKTLEIAYEKNVKIYPLHILTRYYENSLELSYDKILELKFE